MRRPMIPGSTSKAPSRSSFRPVPSMESSGLYTGKLPTTSRSLTGTVPSPTLSYARATFVRVRRSRIHPKPQAHATKRPSDRVGLGAKTSTISLKRTSAPGKEPVNGPRQASNDPGAKGCPCRKQLVNGSTKGPSLSAQETTCE